MEVQREEEDDDVGSSGSPCLPLSCSLSDFEIVLEVVVGEDIVKGLGRHVRLTKTLKLVDA